MAVIEEPQQQAAVPNTLACAECCRTLPSMKRCTQCRAVLYCSRECQVKHWPSHKEACKRLPQEMRERAHKLAEQVTLQEPRFNFEPTPSWKLGAPSDLDVARMEHGGAELRGFSYPSDPVPVPKSAPKLPTGMRMVSEQCKRCNGDGKVQRDMPAKVPLHRLEGGATGFVQREHTCPDCSGFGTVTGERRIGAHDDPHIANSQNPIANSTRKSKSRSTCYRCQASSDDLCTCQKPLHAASPWDDNLH